MKQAGAELCQAQSSAKLTSGYPLVGGKLVKTRNLRDQLGYEFLKNGG